MVAMARRGGGVGETQQGEEDLETTTAHLFDSYAGQEPEIFLPRKPVNQPIEKPNKSARRV